MLTTNAPLPKPLRNQLENTIKAARDIAENAARAALNQLGVGENRVPNYLSEDQRNLRRRLRAHGRSLGDVKFSGESQSLTHLVWEVSYEHWHRMLFARFLAENGLLMWEPGAAVTLDDCRDIVDNYPEMALNSKSGWELAGKLAARMLPQIFKPQSPVFELNFAPEYERDLERLLISLPSEVFKATDSLGWVYQFWQAKRKDEVNASEKKIGADELPAVTQLFTEPYMVDFLLHNSLGAWWVTRYPEKRSPVDLDYLRILEDGSPAAGRYEDWPNTLAEFKLLDPCCGSGHFLVAAFLLLVPMRMSAEGLSTIEAVDAVLAENLHGLEIDPRCVEIAVFAVALAAWRYPDEAGNPLGVRPNMLAPNIACCGIKVSTNAQSWEALVPDNTTNASLLRQELHLLHDTFTQAPLLGSLLDPTRSIKGDLATSNLRALKQLLEQALNNEEQHIPATEAQDEAEESWDLAVSAHGLIKAAHILTESYNLIITNVPYLAHGKQSESLKDYCKTHYPAAKNDLANVFLERCLELAKDNGRGVVQVIMPQNWLFLTGYKKQREVLLKTSSWNLLARLGMAAFDVMDWWAFNVIALTLTRKLPTIGHNFSGIDTSEPRNVEGKATLLRQAPLTLCIQHGQLGNPDSVITLESSVNGQAFLKDYAYSLVGIQTADDPRYMQTFWERPVLDTRIWEWMVSTPETFGPDFVGLSWTLRWEQGKGALSKQFNACIRGTEFISRQGVVVHRMGQLSTFRFIGGFFHQNPAVLIPKNDDHLLALWAYGKSGEFAREVRKLDQGLKVTNGTLAKVPFDLDHWKKVATEQYPNGLPKPYSDDPTQWIFHGHPRPSTFPLQVGIMRLLGYKWPAELDNSMELSKEARTWCSKCGSLSAHVDDDGIVCLPAVRGEKPAHERLLALLIDAWETVEQDSWKSSILDKLLTEVDSAGKGLDVWLRDKFFEQHSKAFHHRPFIWHIWDGLKDGFSALVNYHKLDAKNLERLIHTYLGDWIRVQESDVAAGIDGAAIRLSAAQDLKRRLQLILDGESDDKAGYDIFVRWKSIEQQPVGWQPDLNDGVRLNIRPFITAEVLRQNKKPKLNISWDKDRGKDVESAPWFKVFKGERINDFHLTLAEKRAARDSK